MTWPRILWILMLLQAKFTYQEDEISFNILHTSDINAHVQETGGNGGLPRMITFVRKERELEKNTLVFETGDSFFGTLWFKVFGAAIITPFIKLLKPDAIGFGDNELDNGTQGLHDFITGVEAPFLCCNCDASKEPLLSSLIVPSVKLKIEDTEIGVTAYLTENVAEIRDTFKTVTLRPQLKAVQEEVQKFQNQNISIIILLGHGSLQEHTKIIEEVDGIDILVAGHSRIFLYTGTAPKEMEDVEVDGEYPLMIKNKKGHSVPLVHAYEYSKMVGKFSVTFNKTGGLIKYSGNPVFMNSSIKEDEEALKILEEHAPMVEIFGKRILGVSRVDLSGECKVSECNLANLFTDAMVDFMAAKHTNKYWTENPIAIVNAGAFFTGITFEDEVKTITYGHIMAACPYDDILYTVTLNGSTIKKMIEFSIEEDEIGYRKFLQYSGVHVKFNFAKTGASRVESIKVRCGQCDIPKYEDLSVAVTYNLITSDYLARGGNRFSMIKRESHKQVAHSTMVNDVLVNYIERYKVIQTNEEERIIIENPKSRENVRTSSAKIFYLHNQMTLSMAMTSVISFF